MKKIGLLITGLIVLSTCTSDRNFFGLRPNIVWIMIENQSQELSCYGAKGVNTPNIDQFASQGIRYENSFCTAPVCSASRSAMMTGFYQNYIECHQHRTAGPGFVKKELPHGIKPIVHLLEEAGYYTCLMRTNKTDLNFTVEKPLFMGSDWSGRKPGQPFFAQVTFKETDRGYGSEWDSIVPINISSVTVPPYYPDVPFARRDIAYSLENVQNVDWAIGQFLKRLDDEGVTENTIVFLIADNGTCMPRGIQFLYDDGIKIPFIVRWPGHISPGQVSDRMVMTIDISATILDLAGIKPEYELHGKNIFGKEVEQRKYIFAARDKMDWTFDAMRAIRSREYKLIHNLMPERPYCQFNIYKEAHFPMVSMLNMMYLKGELDSIQSRFMAATKPEFELYDMKNDPYELNNLADNPSYSEIKESLMAELMAWRQSINDQGVSEEFRKGGWPSIFPTRSLEEWTAIVEKWEKWFLLRSNRKEDYPQIDFIPGTRDMEL